jgi:hypothetical protein
MLTLITAGVFVLGVIYLPATSRSVPTSHPTSTSQVTPATDLTSMLMPSPSRTLIVSPKIATAERETTLAALAATRWAQGTRPIVTPFPSVIATRVPRTPVTGIHYECAHGSREYSVDSCWTGIGGGEYVYVNSLVYKGYGRDPEQGVLLVYTSTLDLGDYSEREEYSMPLRLGPIRLVEANWPLISMRTLEHTPVITFTFDLSTRQWVEPVSTPMGILSPLDPTKAAAATIVAQTNAEIATRAALTAAPTRTRGRPPSYPSSTPQLGLATGSGAKNSGEPFFISSWTGIVDGELIGVEAGREGRYGDLQQGVILVYNISRQEPAEIYQTPQRIGAVRIVAVVGNLFTLAPIDYRTPGALETPWAAETPAPIFTFDLSTRQWVSPPSTPNPSPSTSPPASPQVSPSP